MFLSNSIQWIVFLIISLCEAIPGEQYAKNPAPDGHRYSYKFVEQDREVNWFGCMVDISKSCVLRNEFLYTGCGVCPTYFQKICGFDIISNNTFIFDNHCIMDLYNCLKGTEFVQLHYDRCLYFGNFAYVHGVTYEDKDYGEDGIFIDGIKKNQAGFS